MDQRQPGMTLQLRVSARLPVVVDDLLKRQGSRRDVTTAPATRCNPTMRAVLDKHVKATAGAYQRDVVPFLLRSDFDVTPAAGAAGTSTRLHVRVHPESWAPAWDADVMVWNVVWRMDTTASAPAGIHSASLLSELRTQVRAGVLDGWGEGVAQASRFGPLCAYDDTSDAYRPATPQEARRIKLHAYESGRYATLLTLKGAVFRVLTTSDKDTTREHVPVKGARARARPARHARPSPSISATSFPAGTVKRGNDGRSWVVKETVQGVRRWVATT